MSNSTAAPQQQQPQQQQPPAQTQQQQQSFDVFGFQQPQAQPVPPPVQQAPPPMQQPVLEKKPESFGGLFDLNTMKAEQAQKQQQKQ